MPVHQAQVAWPSPEVAFHQNRGAVIEWVCERRERLNPTQPVICKRQVGKKWRNDAEWINCRTEIVPKARKGDLSGPDATSVGRLSFPNFYIQACLGQNYSCREAVRTAADDGCGTHYRILPKSGLWPPRPLV